MTIPGWNDPADEERNPRRPEERRHARDELEARLRERHIDIGDGESDEDVIAIVNAVEDFEARVSRLGGDTFTNTPESSAPDDAEMVIPLRREGESAIEYAARVRVATGRLTRD